MVYDKLYGGVLEMGVPGLPPVIIHRLEIGFSFINIYKASFWGLPMVTLYLWKPPYMNVKKLVIDSWPSVNGRIPATAAYCW